MSQFIFLVHPCLKKCYNSCIKQYDQQKIMKLPIIYYGHPTLRKKGERVNEINDELRKLVDDMIETMLNNNGIGLAAPQVNRSLTLFITHPPTDEEGREWPPERKIKVFINPKILSFSEEIWTIPEMCLSIPHISGHVTRPYKVTFEATDLEGNRFVEDFTGFEARMMMHENDHINGVLYIDRVKGKERKEIEVQLRELKKKLASKL